MPGFRMFCTLSPASLSSYFFIFKLIWEEWAVGKFFTRLFSNSAEAVCPPWPQARGWWDRDPGAFRGLGEGWLRRPVTPDPRPVPDSHLERRAGCLLAPSGGLKPHSGASTGRGRGGGGPRPLNPPFNFRLNRAGLGRAIWSPATDTEGALRSFRATFPARGRLPFRICSTFEKEIHLRGGGFA